MALISSAVSRIPSCEEILTRTWVRYWTDLPRSFFNRTTKFLNKSEFISGMYFLDHKKILKPDHAENLEYFFIDIQDFHFPAISLKPFIR